MLSVAPQEKLVTFWVQNNLRANLNRQNCLYQLLSQQTHCHHTYLSVLPASAECCYPVQAGDRQEATKGEQYKSRYTQPTIEQAAKFN